MEIVNHLHKCFFGDESVSSNVDLQHFDVLKEILEGDKLIQADGFVGKLIKSLDSFDVHVELFERHENEDGLSEVLG